MKYLKYKGSKVALGVVFILLSLYTVGNISFSSAESFGYSLVPITEICLGVFLIYRGMKNPKKDLSNL